MKYIKKFENILPFSETNYNFNDSFFNSEDLYYIELLVDDYWMDENDVIFFTDKVIKMFKRHKIEYRTVFFDKTTIHPEGKYGIYIFFNQEIQKNYLPKKFPIKKNAIQKVDTDGKRRSLAQVNIEKLVIQDKDIDSYFMARKYNL
jgi:hypothetical protein